MNTRKRKVFILGGGPAALGLAWGLAQQGEDFVLIEKDQQLGGLAKTMSWQPYGYHDLGPHKIFTINQALWKKIHSLLPSHAWIVQEKSSRIFIAGHYLPYPPSPFSLIKVYGIFSFFKMMLDFAFAKLRSLIPIAEPLTFEEDLHRRLGKTLYKLMFEPLAIKLWGKGNELDIKLSKGRVQVPSIKDVIFNLLGLSKKNSFEAKTFHYPRGGLQTLWDGIVEICGTQGTFHTKHELRSIQTKDGIVKDIQCMNLITNEVVSFEVSEKDFVFSTLPISILPDKFSPQLDPSITENLKKNIHLNHLKLVFLKIVDFELFKDSWVFIPDPKIIFHRVSEQKSFDPGMTPNGSIVCCEIMLNESKRLPKSNDEIVKACILDLQVMLGKSIHIQDSKVIDLPSSYPVYKPGFESGLVKALNVLDGFSNFRTIGRQGSFNYIGTLDALDIGLGSADWFHHFSDKEESIQRWSQERDRTKHYPVLD